MAEGTRRLLRGHRRGPREALPGQRAARRSRPTSTGGGRALFLLPATPAAASSRRCSPWGVKLGNDVVVDQVVRLFQGPALGLAPLVNTYAPARDHPGLQGAHHLPDDALGPRRRRRQGRPHRHRAGQDQPVELGGDRPRRPLPAQRGDARRHRHARVRYRSPSSSPPISSRWAGARQGTARLAVFGSTEFADNREFDGTYFNRDLFLNTIGWLVGQADLLSIRPRAIRASRVQFTAAARHAHLLPVRPRHSRAAADRRPRRVVAPRVVVARTRHDASVIPRRLPPLR